MKKILLSNKHLCEFGGSELVTVELAEHYASLGYEVTLYSPKINVPLLPTINRTNLKLTNEVPAQSELQEFDIVWSHHGLLLNQINSKNKSRHQIIVSNHMSSYVEDEFPTYDASLVDFIFANSEETRSVLPERHRQKCRLFQNPSYIPAIEVGITYRNKPLALSITNHRPAELISAMIDYSDKIEFVFMGKGTEFYERIDSDRLANIDPNFIICNGKTTQAAFMAGIPVFLYDQFGGCGWLTESNFERAEQFNFSGRGFEQKADLKTLLDFDRVEPIKIDADRLKKFDLHTWLQHNGLLV